MTAKAKRDDGRDWPYDEALSEDKESWNYFSPSTLMSADPQTDTGCRRKTFYEKKMGLKGPEQKWQTHGKDIHKEIEIYLETGDMSGMGPLSRAGIHMFPKPRNKDFRILVEHEIGGGDLASAPLRAAGVPVVGYIDCIHWQEQNQGTTDILDAIDPIGTVEIIDWKCLGAGSEIFDVSRGRRQDVSELGELTVATYQTPEIGQLPSERMLRTVGKATSFASGKKQCVEIRLKDGSTLVASHDHPIMTQRGWVLASKLRPTDWVAVASSAPEPASETLISDNDVKFLAYMFADGCCSQSGMSFTNMTPEVIEEWSQCATNLNYKIVEQKQRSKARQFQLSGNRGTRWNPAQDEFRTRWNLYGLAKAKRLHADLWGMSNRQTALFLNRFWACDGYVTDHAVGVELASEKMIDDLKFLLLRLGIRARKNARRHGKFTSWILSCNGTDAIKFLDQVGDVLGKEQACRRLRNQIRGMSSKADRLPLTRSMVQEILDELGFARYPGVPVSVSRYTAKRELNPTSNGTVTKTRFLAFCEKYNYTGKFSHFNSPDVSWEPVVRVRSRGVLPVFDLNVPKTHSFSANSFIVHNTTSDWKWAKGSAEVASTLQMTTYGKWAVETRGAEWVRLSHGYFVTKGRHTPRKVSLRIHKDQINKRWEYVEQLAGSLVDDVRQKRPEDVPANTAACGAFRGCPHANYCPDSPENKMFAQVGHDLLTVNTPKLEVKKVTGNYNMSLLSKLTGNNPPATSKEDEMHRLATEELNAKYPGAIAAVLELEKLGLGMPQLSGEAARVYCVAKRQPLSAALTGSGDLGVTSFTKAEDLIAVLDEAKEIAAARGTPVIDVPLDPFPTDAPEALKAPPVEETPKVEVVDAATAMAVAAGEVETPKKKRGRPKKAETAELTPEPVQEKITMTLEQATEGTVPVVVHIPEAEAEQLGILDEAKLDKARLDAIALGQSVARTIALDNDGAAATASSNAINLFVDAVTTAPTQSFWPIVKQVTDAIAEKYEGDDYRTCTKEPAKFGGWKGLLAAGLRAWYQAGKIPGGNYSLDNSMNETAGVVIEAMRDIIAQSGGQMVRGVR